MCGIAGVFDYSVSGDTAEDCVRRMLDAQRFRGPNGEGIRAEESLGCALGVRRLALVDVEGGHQPFVSENGAVSLVYNGEIYNHQTLRTELLNAGHRFQGGSDGEPLLHLYEDRDEGFLEKIQGMFALALVDRNRRTLLLARDSPGMKPLYWAHTPAGFVFASTAAAIFASGLLAPAPCSAGIAAFFQYGYIPAPLTAFAGLNRLEAGMVLRVEEGRPPTLRRFAAPVFRPEKSPCSEEERVRELERVLRASVHSHLQGDVPVGAYLSGGVDSSLIASLAAEQGPLHTFSLVFPDYPAVDESTFSRQIARRIGSEHHEIPVSAGDILDGLPLVARALEEPCALPGALHLLLARKASLTHRCVLTGEGADELFAGYPWLAEAGALPWRSRVPAPLARRLCGVFPRLRSSLFWRQLAAPSLKSAFSESLGPFPADEWPGLLLSPGSAVQNDTVIPAATWESAAKLLEKRQAFELTHRMPEGILFLVDKASMSAGVEVRPPFLDQRVMSYALSLPAEWKIRQGREKYLVNRLAAERVPEIRERKKQGLRIPYHAMLLETCGQTFLRGHLLEPRRRMELFHTENLRRFLEQELSPANPAPRTWLLWRLLLLQSWADAWLGTHHGRRTCTR